MSRILKGGAAGLLFALSLPSFAGTLNVDSVTGAFCCASPTSGGETVLFFDSNQEVRWGNNPLGDPRTSRSGLRFDGEAPPSFSIFDDGTPFLLGVLTHFNHPIDDPITQVDMDLFLTLSNGGSTNAGPFAFRYGINETDNSDACNANPAACTPADDDFVSIAALSPLTNLITIGSATYLLGIEGFSTDGGTTITSLLRSPENSDNPAGLYARLVRQPGDDPVPEPSSLFLAGSGLLAAGIRFARSRRAA